MGADDSRAGSKCKPVLFSVENVSEHLPIKLTHERHCDPQKGLYSLIPSSGTPQPHPCLQKEDACPLTSGV